MRVCDYCRKTEVEVSMKVRRIHSGVDLGIIWIDKEMCMSCFNEIFKLALER